MPRGVYSRNGKKKPAAARKLPEKVVPVAVAPVITAAPAASIQPLKVAGQEPKAITAKTHEQLRAYAKTLGINKTDIANLTLRRLQQNCMVRVAEMFEDA